MEILAYIIAVLFLLGIFCAVLVGSFIILNVHFRSLRFNPKLIRILVTASGILILLAVIITAFLGLFTYINKLI